MKLKTLTEFHEQAPRNATHVLKMGDKYEYANFTGLYYDSCDNANMDEVLRSPMSANNDGFFKCIVVNSIKEMFLTRFLYND
jgi:hypothetical protein